VRNIAGAVVLPTRQDCDTCAHGCRSWRHQERL